MTEGQFSRNVGTFHSFTGWFVFVYLDQKQRKIAFDHKCWPKYMAWTYLTQTCCKIFLKISYYISFQSQFKIINLKAVPTNFDIQF